MRGKQAKILSDDNLDDLLLFAETSRHPVRNKVIVLLLAKTGLRAGETMRLPPVPLPLSTPTTPVPPSPRCTPMPCRQRCRTFVLPQSRVPDARAGRA